MNKYELNVDNQEKRQLNKIRSSYMNQAKHLNDNFKNLGYDYIGNLLKNGTSPELWANPQQINLYGKLESLITYVLESSKMVKKWFSIAHDKNTTLLN
jgi:hypothetical protein